MVAKKLALIETCVRELQSLARPDAIRADDREERFVEHTYQDVDLAVVEDVLRNHLGDLLAFVAAVRAS
jgi:hypothetical protein